MKNLNFKKLLPCVAIIATLFFSPVSLANETETETMTQAEALAIDAKHYAAAYGVDETEAMRRLLIMHGSAEEIEALEKTYQDRLAGVYFDNGANFGLNFVLTGDETPQERKLIRKAQKAERKAEKQAAKEEKKAAKQQAKDEKKQQKHYAKWGITEADVDKAISMIEQPTEAKVKFRAKAKDKQINQVSKLEKNFDKLSKQITGFNGAYFDVRDEIFVIQVNKNKAAVVGLDENKITQIATEIFKSPVRIKFFDNSVKLKDFRGGSRLNDTAGNLICTSGFTVKDRTTGQVGIVTAAHCDETNIIYLDKDGSNISMKLVKSELSAKSDMAFYVPNDPKKATASPSFYATSSNPPRGLVGWVSQSKTNAKTDTKPGSFLCHFGAKADTLGYGQSCGEVVDVAYKPVIEDNQGNVINCGKTGAPIECQNKFVAVQPAKKAGQSDLNCPGGNSGGPWFAYGNAYGILKAGAEDNNGQCTLAIYTPIIRINDLDLTLYYGK